MSGIKPSPFFGFKVRASEAIDLKVQASGQTVQGQNSSTWILPSLLSHCAHFLGAIARDPPPDNANPIQEAGQCPVSLSSEVGIWGVGSGMLPILWLNSHSVHRSGD